MFVELNEYVKVISLVGEAGRIISPPGLSEWGRRAVIEDPEGYRFELTEGAEG